LNYRPSRKLQRLENKGFTGCFPTNTGIYRTNIKIQDFTGYTLLISPISA
jgi:hypothetical protein